MVPFFHSISHHPLLISSSSSSPSYSFHKSSFRCVAELLALCTSLSCNSPSCKSTVACSVNHRLRSRTSDLSPRFPRGRHSPFIEPFRTSSIDFRISSLLALLIFRVTQERNSQRDITKFNCFVLCSLDFPSISISTFCKVD